MLVPEQGKGGESPGTRSGQAKGLTAGDVAASLSIAAGEPAMLFARCG